MSNQQIYENRTETIGDLIWGTPILSNGFEIPEQPGRYLVIEKSNGDGIAAYSCEDLNECVREIDESTTEAEVVVIHDLDEGVELVPCRNVTVILSDSGPVWSAPISDSKMLDALKERFDWIDSNEEAEGSDVVDALTQWWHDLGGQVSDDDEEDGDGE